ncbi:MAG TPA: diguanylate cyclase [Anaerolineales bacterium]|nr:diguanylate cyclase [Anaerolineales bacterium]
MLKILVVDDEQIDRRIVEKILTRLGHSVIFADNGESAWQKIQEEPIRFVITDWNMPLMNGIQLIKKIRSTTLSGYVYTIIITSNAKNEDIVAGLYAGADDYLTKPFNPAELEARVAVGERMLALEDGLMQANNQLEKLAMVDSLTGLLNRRAIYKFMRGELERARRVSEPISIIFLDIDNFKKINDEYGHLTGDEALKLIANVIQKRSRAYDNIGRWAGDKFLIVLPGATATDAEKAAQRIIESIFVTKLALPQGGILSLSACAGVVTQSKMTGAIALLDNLIQGADEALYRAKRAGGNNVETTLL